MNMNKGGAFQLSSQVHHQMVGDSPIWWDLNNMRAPASGGHQHSSPLFPSSCSSSSTTSSSTTTTTTTCSSSSPVFPQYTHQPSSTTTWHDVNQELPESWSQLLLGGLAEEELEDRCSYITPFQAKRMENYSWEDQVVLQLSEEVQAAAAEARSSNWSQILPSASSPNNRSSSSSSMLDFSNAKPDQRKHHHQLLDGDHSSECNSTPAGSPYKKARVQASSAQSTFKVRKEKLGDRITALHQLVSPFGKTDTASVLLEAIGYIRFLQSQIQALSSPYLATGSGNINIKQQYVQGERSCIFPEDPGQLLNDSCMKRRSGPAAEDKDGVDEPTKDLRGRGLCLVPASFITTAGSDNAADYWAPTFVGGFR